MTDFERIIDAVSLPPPGNIRYRHIFEAIAEAIRSGALEPGAQLPPQRQLAKQLGVATGTVYRAYAEAARWHLITASVGRGTFVGSETRAGGPAQFESREVVDLTIHRPPPAGAEEAFARTLRQISRDAGLGALLADQPSVGTRRFREAGAAFVARMGLQAEARRIVVCNGVQNGLALILAALAEPGDVVLTEALNYSGVRLLEKIFRLRLRPVEMDAEGVRPDRLEAACRDSGASFVLLTPTIQNPTTRTMSDARREAVAGIVRRHGLRLIENDISGPLPAERRLPIAALAPEQCFYVTGVSKCLTTGLRLGYIVAPETAVHTLATAMKATTWMVSSVMAEVVTRWVHDGTAETIVAWHRREARRRQDIARGILAPAKYECDAAAYALWMPLPASWRASEYAAELQARGVLVSPGETFLVGRDAAPNAVRLSLGQVADDAALTHGLSIVAQLTSQPPLLSAATV